MFLRAILFPRTVFVRKVLVFFLAVFLTTLSTSARTNDIFVVAYENATQFPNYMGDTSEVLDSKPGATVELVALLAEEIPNFEVKFVRYPWKQCLIELKAGTVDGIFNASYREERLAIGAYPWKDNTIDISRRITTISYHFYRIKGSNFDWDGNNVSGLTSLIGTPLGYSVEGDLKSRGIPILSARDILVNFSNLLRGKVNAIALQDVTGDYHIERKSGLSSIEKVHPAIATKPYYLMLSRQFKERHPVLSEKIWDTIAKLREEKLQAIVETYLESQDGKP